MGKRQYAARVDNNQKEIVAELRKRGYTVAVGHDDILVGYQGKTYWYEIKNKNEANKAGQVYKSRIKESQYKLLNSFKGHYKVVTSVEEIIADIHQ